MNYWVLDAAEDWQKKMKIDLVTSSQWRQIAKKIGLSNRELAVTQLLFDQLTRDQIAERLGIKPRTVRQYMENIHEKLRVNTRVGVVLRIIQVRDSL